MLVVLLSGAQKSILGYCDVGRKEGSLLAGGRAGDAAGCYVQPTVFGGVRAKARIHCEEIFGPVLALLRCQNFDDGLRIVRKGVAPGDKVVVNGLMRVRPGMKVAPKVVAMAPDSSDSTMAGR